MALASLELNSSGHKTNEMVGDLVNKFVADVKGVSKRISQLAQKVDLDTTLMVTTNGPVNAAAFLVAEGAGIMTIMTDMTYEQAVDNMLTFVRKLAIESSNTAELAAKTKDKMIEALTEAGVTL